MKKYTKHTDLEQASRDPSLAIITDRITTPEELSKLYAKYRILPKKQKRYSNYYSNEFQGRRVSEMYVLMKDKFKPGGELSEAWQMPKDAFVVSEPDLYYKEESFNQSRIFTTRKRVSIKAIRTYALSSVIREAENPGWQVRWRET